MNHDLAKGDMVTGRSPGPSSAPRRDALSRRAVLSGGLGGAAVFLSGCLSPETYGGSGSAVEGTRIPSNVQMMIPYAVGGGTDVWARYIAPHLSRYIESEPYFVPVNVPGGESITGSNQFALSGGTDGRRILVTSGTTYFQSLLRRVEVEFDFTEMVPLVLNGTGGMIYVSAESGVRDIHDLLQPAQPLVYGGISATGLDLSALLIFKLLGLDVAATFGFEGRGPAALALQRGELTIDYQTTSAYHQQIQPEVDAERAVPLMSVGWLDEDNEVIRDPQLPDFLTPVEVYREIYGEEPGGVEFDAYKAFLAAGFTYQKGIFVNEGTPHSIIDAYYDAVEALAGDESFLADSETILGGYDLYSGRQAGEAFTRSFEISDEVRQYVLDTLRNDYDAEIETR